MESSDSRGSVADDEAELLGQLEPCNVPDCRSRLTLKWVFFFGLLPICGRLIKFSIINLSYLFSYLILYHPLHASTNSCKISNQI